MSILSGASSGAALGSVGGPIGMGIGAVAGSIGGIVKGQQEKKRTKELEDMITGMPKFEDSGAYNTQMALTGRAGREAQQGLPSAVYNRQLENIGRMEASGNAAASSVDDILLGGSARQSNLADMYRDLAVTDAETQAANRGVYYNQAGKSVDMMKEAFEFDEVRPVTQMMELKGQNILRQDDKTNAAMGNLQSMGQNIASNPELAKRFAGFNVADILKKNRGNYGVSGAATGGTVGQI
jgi:hypothetical protein